VNETVKVDPKRSDPDLLERIANVVRSGGIAVFPTETFYGLGGLAADEGAVKKIFLLKGREASKALPVLLPDAQALSWVTDSHDRILRVLVETFWPGPLTIVVRLSEPSRFPAAGKEGTLAVRVSSHPIAAALARMCGEPVIATSANISGGKSPRTIGDVPASVIEGADLSLDAGPLPVSKGSTVVDITCSPPRLIRDGDVPYRKVADALCINTD